MRAARAEALALLNVLTVNGKESVDDLDASTSKLGSTIASLQLKTAVARGEFAQFATGFAEAAAQAGLTDKAAQGLSRTIEGLTPAQRKLNTAMLEFQGAKMLQGLLVAGGAIRKENAGY